MPEPSPSPRPFLGRMLVGLLSAVLLAAPAVPQSVVLVTLDTTRADHLSLYGYKEKTSPILDGLAARGLVFTNATAAIPLTLPSHYAILTGESPWTQGVWLNGQKAVPGEGYLPLRLKKKGYRTGAFLSSAILDRGFGLNAGFDAYDDTMNPTGGEIRERSCAQTTQKALEFLKGGSGPFFLWVHYFEPHAPYAPPEPFRSRFANPYDGEIAAMDACLGELFAALPSNALIIAAGDHGEMLGEHAEREHGVLLYQAAIHVPLVLWGPKISQRRSDKPVSLLDIYPTVLAFLGEPSGKSKEGTSLLDPVPAQRVIEAASIYGREVFGFLPSLAALQGDFKLLAYGDKDFRLFNLEKDPGETTDVFLKERRTSRKLKDDLKALPLPGALTLSLSDEQKKTLSSLGYLTPTAPPSDLVNPEEGLKMEAVLAEAKGLWSSYDLKGAAEKAGQVLKVLPRHTEAMSLLGKLRLQQNRPGDAAELFARVVRLRPSDPTSHLRLGQALRATGDLRTAEAELNIARSMNPRLSETYGELAGLLLARKDYTALAALKGEAEKNAVEDAQLFASLGYAELDQYRPESAFGLFHKAMRMEPSAAPPVRGLVRASLDMGKKSQALIYCRQFLRIIPRDPEINADAGMLVFELEGNRYEALRYLRTALSGCSGTSCDSIRGMIQKIEAGQP